MSRVRSYAYEISRLMRMSGESTLLYLHYANVAVHYFDLPNVNISGSFVFAYRIISRVLYSSNGRSRARLEARKFMNEETAGMTQEHSFCNVRSLGRQNEPFGDIRTSVGGSLLRGIASAASELVSKRIRTSNALSRGTYESANLWAWLCVPFNCVT